MSIKKEFFVFLLMNVISCRLKGIFVRKYVAVPVRLEIIIITIIIILGISFTQGIYTYIPETNHVPREHCVATILM